MENLTVTLELAPYVAEAVGDWIRDYQQVTQRQPTGDPATHEQQLIEMGRLLGSAAVTLRLLADNMRPQPAGPAAVNGYPVRGEAPYPLHGTGPDDHMPPMSQPRFAPFGADHELDRP